MFKTIVVVVLTATLILALLFSAFVFFVIVSSKKRELNSGTSLLHLQLSIAGGLLALLFIVFSTPSLLQNHWVASRKPVPKIDFNSPTNTSLNVTIDTLGNNYTLELDYFINYLDNNITVLSTRSSTYQHQPFSANYTSPLLLNSTPTSHAVLLSILTPHSLMQPNNSFTHPNTSFTQPEMFNYYNITDHPLLNETDDNNISFSNQSSILVDESGWDEERDMVCRLYGFLLVLLQVAATWVVVGLHCDKYCAIAEPLRYNQIVTRRRVAALSSLAWLVALIMASSPLGSSFDYAYNDGVCLPVWHLPAAVAYTWCLTLFCALLPTVVIAATNARIIIIARQHQHRIFSAIFEVMMSAQAPVTHQKNSIDLPRKKFKSEWTVLQELAAFILCYYPFFGVILYESISSKEANDYLVLIGISLLLFSTLVNSLLYGIKCKSIRRAFKNYLRKQLYKTEVKAEIEARIPSASNSRRPSISSTLAMPMLQKSLQRRMSDYLLHDQLPSCPPGAKLIRRSSDLSWHPLEAGTPSPTRLRRPLDLPIDFSPQESPSPSTTMANFLTVPTFEAARWQTLNNRRTSSSIDSEVSISIHGPTTEEEFLMASMDVTPSHDAFSRSNDGFLSPNYMTLFNEDNSDSPSDEYNKSRSKSLELPRLNHIPIRRKSNDIEERKKKTLLESSHTPLLCEVWEKPVPAENNSLTVSSPHVIQTLESILSVRLSQALLRRGSGWGGSHGSLEKLSQFLRDHKPCESPPKNMDSYSILSLQNGNANDHEMSDDNESPRVDVMTFINPLPNGGACHGVCVPDAPIDIDSSLTVT